MKNFVADGKSIQLTAPSGGVTGGSIYKQGVLIGVVVASAAEGEQFTLMLAGAYSGLPKTASQAWAVGDKLYWDATAGSLTTTSTSNTYAGHAYSAALSAATTGDILLGH
jgi:predicted RecA/RadA family phage recombinase